jgi:hypothetical protein
MTKAKDRLLEYTAKQKADNEELDVREASIIITNTVIDGYEVVVNTLNSGQARFHLQDIADNGMDELLEEEFGTYNSNDALDAIQSDIESSYNKEWKLEWIEFTDGSGGLGFEIAGEKILVDKLVDTDGNVQVSHIVEQSDYETQDIDELLRNELYADSLHSPNISIKYTEKDTYSELLEQYQNQSKDSLKNKLGSGLYGLSELGVSIFIASIIFIASMFAPILFLPNSDLIVFSSTVLMYLLPISYLSFIYPEYILPRLAALKNREERVVRESLYSVPDE